MVEPFLDRNIIPTIADTNWNDDNIGYARTIDVSKIASPCMLSYDATKEGTGKEKDNPIANNHTFLLTNLRMGFKE